MILPDLLRTLRHGKENSLLSGNLGTSNSSFIRF